MAPKVNTERIDSILLAWRPIIGRDYDGYRNHVVRMATFCQMLRPCSPEEQRKIEVAACFHDIGLWTEQTLNYLAPSVRTACGYLVESGLEDWSDEITQMILEHHKVRAVVDEPSPLVELFRQGDLVDFSLGLVRCGLSRHTVKQVKTELPNAGFHKMLVRRSGGWFLKHPLNPAPMMKW